MPIFLRSIRQPAKLAALTIPFALLGGASLADPAPTPVEPVHVTDAPPSTIAEPDIGQASSPDDLAAVHHMAARQIVAVLGDQVRFEDGSDVGRIVDVLVDRAGSPVGAVLDCGGYLGVGNRKVAVSWSSLHFAPSNDATEIVTTLTPDQVKSAPEYHEAADADLVTTGNGAKLPPSDKPPAINPPAAITPPAAKAAAKPEAKPDANARAKQAPAPSPSPAH